MNNVDNNIIEHENYIELENFNKFGIKIYFTNRKYGNILDKSLDEIKKDFNINKTIISSHQTHSANVELVKDTNNLYFENTDGFLTSNTDIAFLTKYADCLPVFIFDEETDVFGVVHSGWKGTFQEITLEAIKKIKNKKDFSKIHILFGIGISCEKYDVGEEFLEKFKQKFDGGIVEKAFLKKDNKIYFDNQLFNYHLFLSYGIPKENICLNSRCTFSENFHSYRRDKEKSGRNGAIIWKEF